MIERSEISQHEVLVYQTLALGKWLSNREISQVSGVLLRTVRAHTLKLVRLGIADQAEIFPGHRYRISEYASSRNRGYLDRILRAAEVLGIDLSESSKLAQSRKGLS